MIAPGIVLSYLLFYAWPVIFKPLDPTLARKAIEGYQNELEPQRKALEVFYRQFRCLRCKSECRKETVSGHTFSDVDTLVPRSCLRCLSCACLFDPHSGLLLKMGQPGQLPPDIPLIVPGKR